MKQVIVTLNIDEDMIMQAVGDTGTVTLDDAISQELGWLHDSGMFVENWSYSDPEQAIEQGRRNTKITYLYRDADNYKSYNECVVKGVLTEAQQKVILDCLQDGEYFIPSQVGLPEKRFDDGLTESDHCWFELDASGFEETSGAPTVDLLADDLVHAFRSKKDRWDDTYLPQELEDNPKQPSLSEQIRSASVRASESPLDSKVKNPEFER